MQRVLRERLPHGVRVDFGQVLCCRSYVWVLECPRAPALRELFPIELHTPEDRSVNVRLDALLDVGARMGVRRAVAVHPRARLVGAQRAGPTHRASPWFCGGAARCERCRNVRP